MKRFNWKLTALIVLAGIAWYLLRSRKSKRLYGCLLAQMDTDETIDKMKETGMYMSREAIYFSVETHSKNVDELLERGYMVQINFNYKPTGDPVMFPTDLEMVERRAESFFQYHSEYRDQIPVVVCENEWDNKKYREEIIVGDYLAELAVVVRVGHKYGFKVADAGTTGNTMERWTWSQLGGELAKWWQKHYHVGKDNEYNEMLAMMGEYTMGIMNIPVDYINTHWYNETECSNGYPLAIEAYKRAMGKMNTPLINNEWGINIKSQSLFEETKREIEEAGAEIMIAYSGVDEPQKAIQLTDSMMRLLH